MTAPTGFIFNNSIAWLRDWLLQLGAHALPDRPEISDRVRRPVVLAGHASARALDQAITRIAGIEPTLHEQYGAGLEPLGVLGRIDAGDRFNFFRDFFRSLAHARTTTTRLLKRGSFMVPMHTWAPGAQIRGGGAHRRAPFGVVAVLDYELRQIDMLANSIDYDPVCIIGMGVAVRADRCLGALVLLGPTGGAQPIDRALHGRASAMQLDRHLDLTAEAPAVFVGMPA